MACGRRCVIGCFIPDDHVALGIADDVLGLLAEYPDLLKHMPSRHYRELLDLQKVHDNINPECESVSAQRKKLLTAIDNLQGGN